MDRPPGQRTCLYDSTALGFVIECNVLPCESEFKIELLQLQRGA